MSRLDDLWTALAKEVDDWPEGYPPSQALYRHREAIETEAIGEAAEGLLKAAGAIAVMTGHKNQESWPCIGGPMNGATVPLRGAYKVLRLDGAPAGEYRRTQIDVGRFAYMWVAR